MSLSPNCRTVRCDGHECEETAHLPVALRHTIGGELRSTAAEGGDIAGWLFVGHAGDTRHFCPCCLPRYLDQAIGTYHGSLPSAPPTEGK